MSEPTASDPVTSRTGSFVGRAHEMAVLRASLDEAVRGFGRLLLLSGEPGIGKTRTAEELAGEAGSLGIPVLWGRCHEGEGAPAYWPWAQALRTLSRATDPEVLRKEIGAGAEDLALVVPEILADPPDRGTRSALDPAEARFRVFRSVAELLENAARRTPLMLVLDDLHWADVPSLLMLRFLAHEMAKSRLLVIGTYRDVEVGRDHPLFEALGELTRAPVARRMALRGFDAKELASYFEDAGGATPASGVIDSILRETGGNPFFVGEVVRVLLAEGGLARLVRGAIGSPPPETVREVIARRLAKLSSGANAVLEIASVVGRDFVVHHVERLADLPRERFLAALDEASVAGIIAADPDALASFRFSHALVRETIYEQLPILRRATLHRRVGELLEQIYGEESKPHLTTLAHHFFEAARGGGDISKATSASQRAGDHAEMLLAFEEAVRHYERALQAADLAPDRFDDLARLKLLRALGNACLKADVAPERKMVPLERAVELAARIGAPELQAETALEYHAAVDQGPLVDTGAQVPALEGALAALGGHDSALAARLLASLVLAQPRSKARQRLSEARAARAMADRVGDPETRCIALSALHAALLGPDSTEERLPISAEIVRVSRELGEPISGTAGYSQPRVLDLCEIGDMAAADAFVAEACRLYEQTHCSYLQFSKPVWLGMRASHEGRFEDAERFALAVFDVAERSRKPWYAGAAGALFFEIRRSQGRLAEIDAVVRGVAEKSAGTDRMASEAMVALLDLEMGRDEQARRWLDATSEDDFRRVEMGWCFLFILSAAATIAHQLQDRKRAAILYERLQPYRERNVVVVYAILCLGSVSARLGLLATTLRRFDDAERHFEDAIAFDRRTGGRPWLARAKYAYAEMLEERGRPEDLPKLREHLAGALVEFEQLGMAKDVERAAALQRRVGAHPAEGSPAPLPSAPPEASPSIFRRDGDYWTISYEGAECRLRDARGLAYLAILLERPGSEIHAAELVMSVAGAPSGGGNQRRDADLPEASRRDLGDSGPKIDAVAARSYQRRLAELREEIAEAEGNADRGRVASLRDELEALTDQLVGQGSGGRQGSHGERARQAVTKAIGVVLPKIQRHLPALAQHFDATIKRGYFCCYRPDPRRQIAWRTR